jgi:glycosyl hydrolase family 42 (putative beta-galactosidase)
MVGLVRWATVVAAMFALAAPSAVDAKPLFGFNDSAESFAEHAGYAATDAQIARLPVSWELTEPTRGSYDFSELDPAVSALEARGVRVLFVISAAPEWAATGCVPDAPASTCSVGRGHEEAYQRLALALLSRYRGSKIQAWNEPNIAEFGALHPKRAAQLTNALYAVAPGRIIGPAASPGDARHLPYTRRMYRHINRHVPLAVNFYPRSVVAQRSIGTDWRYTRDIAGHRRIWVTEIGFASSEYGDSGQAAKAVMAYRFLDKHGAHAVIFHRLVDVPVAGSPWLSSLGLLDADGQPKPAFTALTNAVQDG